MTDERFWEGVATGAGIVGLIVTPVVAIWLHSRNNRNEQRISNMEKYFDDRISEFQQTLYESDGKRDAEYRFLWNEIEKLKLSKLTLNEKNRLLSYLNGTYREKIDVNNRF